MTRAFNDLTGKRFGRLLVLELSHVSTSGETGQRIWKCRCACGKVTYPRTRDLNSGNSKGCGCVSSVLTHGHTLNRQRTRTYSSWQNMLARCLNTSAVNWSHYGGRGIKVCKRWRDSFENFLTDMGKCPKGKSLDRIDTNGNYKRANCRWATQVEQCNNMTNNVNLTLNGKTQSVSAWARELEINKSTIYHRLGRGWSPQEALNA